MFTVSFANTSEDYTEEQLHDNTHTHTFTLHTVTASCQAPLPPSTFHLPPLAVHLPPFHLVTHISALGTYKEEVCNSEEHTHHPPCHPPAMTAQPSPLPTCACQPEPSCGGPVSQHMYMPNTFPNTCTLHPPPLFVKSCSRGWTQLAYNNWLTR